MDQYRSQASKIIHMPADAFAPPPLPTLVEFLKSLRQRIDEAPNTKPAGPMLAITEGHDSFLIDSIVNSNTFMSKVWPADRELDESAVVEAFIAAVTSAHRFDKRLQKIFDKLVPKKTSEITFWRRYFAHVHALLSRLVPTATEQTHDLLSKLPAPRDAPQRRYPAAEPMRDDGEMSRAEVLRTLRAMAEEMSSEATIAALGDAAAAAMKSEEYPSLDTALARLCMHFQLEYMEKLGFDRRFGSLSLQPGVLSQRFPDGQGKDAPIFEALQAFVTACNRTPAMAKMRRAQLPSDDPSARRFAPAAQLTTPPESLADAAQLHALVDGIRTFVEDDDTARELTVLTKAAIEQVDSAPLPRGAPRTAPACDQLRPSACSSSSRQS